MQRLDCHVKEYAWGKKGADSEVANLFAAGHEKFKIQEDDTYAELWMGTHPDGPARLSGTNQLLSSFIAKSESPCYHTNNNLRQVIHLPFIMKVMSIDKTLSLQVHPTKEQAIRLHESDPFHYPDRHHKPELAFALTRFELLCGFRPAKEIVANMQAFAPLRDLMGNENCEKLIRLVAKGAETRGRKCKIALAECFKTQLEREPIQVEGRVEALLALLDRGVRGALKEETVAVIRKMAVDFPGDVGIFAPLYVNHMVLQPGECCYYEAQELHAYLSGECIECVGCSNNTIRAALTPKYIDREALCEVLNYQVTEPREYLVPAQTLQDYPSVDEYAPDCKDFQLHRIRVSVRSPLPARLPPLDCASIVVVVKGSGRLEEVSPGGSCERVEGADSQEVSRGDIIYIPPGLRVAFVSCTEDIEAYRTFSYELGPDHEIEAPEALPLSSPAQKISPVPSKAIIKTTFTEATLDRVDSGMFEVESEMDGFL